MAEAVFDFLNGLNVNGHTEKKNVSGKELTYLSWPWAWAEVKKRYPDAHYTIWKNEKGLPYTFDPETGYMVYTNVTIDGITHEMWLPVMDGANKAMKAVRYSYKTKYGDKVCEAASMMDINKTIMRCLVKNLAMFGLGLYIYAGEDLPEGEEEKQIDKAPEKPVKAEKVEMVEPKAVSSVTTTVPAMSAEMKYLSNELAFVAKEQQTTMDNIKVAFEVNRKAAVKQKIVPDKKVTEYTMDELKVALEYMKKNLVGGAA